MNLSIVLLGLSGCLLYVASMSALGRWLAGPRENASVAYIASASAGTVVV